MTLDINNMPETIRLPEIITTDNTTPIDIISGQTTPNLPDNEIVKIAEGIDDQKRDQVIGKFRTWHNLQNVTEDTPSGSKEAHALMTNSYYSDLLLPLVSSIHSHTLNNGNHAIHKYSSYALTQLDKALDFYFSNIGSADKKATLTAPKTDLKSGKSSDFYQFTKLMRKAKEAAIFSITQAIDEPIEIDPQIPLPKYIKDQNLSFVQLAKHALQEYAESEYGIIFPKEFTQQLTDPKIKAVVLSFDYNSTFNVDESFTDSQLLADIAEHFQLLNQAFKEKLKDKKLFIVINTGRPSEYCWAAIDSLTPFPEIRKLALAESGGVIMENIKGHVNPEVNVQHAGGWGQELDRLYFALNEKASNGSSIKREAKKSMLSVQIHLPRQPETILNFDDQKTPMDAQWYQEFIHGETGYLATQAAEIRESIDQIKEEMIKDYSVSHSRISNELDEVRTARLEQAKERLEVIQEMQKHLEVAHNATAGFLDIKHNQINKYSGLITVLKKLKIGPQQAFIMHVGDSSTDIIPTTETGPTEHNENAEKAYLYGVANSSNSLRQAIAKRQGYGNLTARPQILGLIDIAKGLLRVVFEHSSPNQNSQPISVQQSS